MRDPLFKTLVKNYELNERDIEKLQSLKELVSASKAEFLDRFYERIFSFEHAGKFLSNKEIIDKHKSKLGEWLEALFCGIYDEEYFKRLETISKTHVRIALPPHYVNTALHVVRSFLRDLLIKNDQIDALESIDKILDINFDLLSGLYSNIEQTDTLHTIETIHHALKDDAKGVVPFLQPIVCATTLNIKKYECLIRIVSNIETISPYKFLDISKKIGLYDELSQAMIRKTTALFWNKNSHFSLNLSFNDIQNQETMALLRKNLLTFPNPERITLEIVESEYIQDIELLESFVQEMKKIGCKIAIDDFGAGFSNYENIIKIAPDIIKIDGSLIKDIDKNEKHEAIVENIIALTKKLNISSVAEFVHSKEVHEKLRHMEIDCLQGYYLGEPFCSDLLSQR